MTEPDDEFMAKYGFGGFIGWEDKLKTGKWNLSNHDLNFIALQNTYIHETLKHLAGYGLFFLLIVVLLAILQTGLLYALAVKLGAISPS